MAKTKSSIIPPSVLAFERKLDVSDALFGYGKWEERNNSDVWNPITIREKSVRGTISNRLKAKEQDPANLDAKIESPNLQTVDVAMLPNDADTLKVRFTLRVISGVGSPSACNNYEYLQKLKEVVRDYREKNNFFELGRRYAVNIANGRFLWRNRLGAEEVEVHVMHREKGEVKKVWTFDALGFSLRDFEIPEKYVADIEEIGSLIERGLAKEQSYALFDIIAFVRIGEGQEVFPSEELILDKSNSKNGRKSKTLYSIDGIAAMHSQKIGNAIRTIDTWYPDAINLGPIAIEPYGSVTSQSKAYRQPKQRQDFYTLFDNWVLKDEIPDKENQHFVMAVLVRGGVFGEKEKE